MAFEATVGVYAHQSEGGLYSGPMHAKKNEEQKENEPARVASASQTHSHKENRWAQNDARVGGLSERQCPKLLRWCSAAEVGQRRIALTSSPRAGGAGCARPIRECTKTRLSLSADLQSYSGTARTIRRRTQIWFSSRVAHFLARLVQLPNR